MFSSLDVSTSALVAQRARLNAISSNIANMSTTRNERGEAEPYQPRYVTFQTDTNLTTPGGRVDTGPEQLTLRIHGRVAKPEEIGELVVRQVGGHSVRVKDVAKVEDGAEERVTAAQLNGRRTVTLQVRKQSGSNTVKEMVINPTVDPKLFERPEAPKP